MTLPIILICLQLFSSLTVSFPPFGETLMYKLRVCRHVSRHHCEGYWLLSWCQKPFTLFLRLGSKDSKISTRFVSKEKTVLPESLEAEQRDSLGFTRLGGWLNWRRTDRKQRHEVLWRDESRNRKHTLKAEACHLSLRLWKSDLLSCVPCPFLLL